MEEKGVIDLYCRLKNADIKIWIDGGWGVDALLGKQTRIHQDLDIVIQQKDLYAFRKLLADQGYDELETGIARPYNFVLSDNHQHEIDVHVIVFNDKGDGIYGPAQQGELYPAASLTGKGKIAGQEVHCISPEYAVSFHSGYAMKEKDRMDILAICKAFDLEVPKNIPTGDKL